MARKNLLGALMDSKLPAGNSDQVEPQPVRNPVSSLVSQGAIGAVSRSIEQLKNQAAEAQRIQEQLTTGQTIVELDPSSIDGATIKDRLGVSIDVQDELQKSIAEQGQQVPILVRPHPSTAGRYQVAYGHRRLQAALSLGRRVKAVVRPLTDEELVVAQGVENSARANLSFIERAVYAARLEDAGFNRATIMAALSIDKTALSKLIAVPARIPMELVLAIGPAPKIGRDRWLELADKIEKEKDTGPLLSLVQETEFLALGSEERFERVLRKTSVPKKVASRQDPSLWKDEAGKRIGRVLQKPHELVVSVSSKAEPGFAEFLRGSLPRLLQEFRDHGAKAKS